jgi:preprotein translocase subunit SecF
MVKWGAFWILLVMSGVAMATTRQIPFQVDFSRDARISFSGLSEQAYDLECYEQTCYGEQNTCNNDSAAHSGTVFVTYQRNSLEQEGHQPEILAKEQATFLGSSAAHFDVPAEADAVDIVVVADLPTSGFCRLTPK